MNDSKLTREEYVLKYLEVAYQNCLAMLNRNDLAEINSFYRIPTLNYCKGKIENIEELREKIRALSRTLSQRKEAKEKLFTSPELQEKRAGLRPVREERVLPNREERLSGQLQRQKDALRPVERESGRLRDAIAGLSPARKSQLKERISDSSGSFAKTQRTTH